MNSHLTTHDSFNQELLDVIPDQELDLMLARALGYRFGRDLLKIRSNKPHVEVFHLDSWRRFSHTDPSILWALVVKHGISVHQLPVSRDDDLVQEYYPVCREVGMPIRWQTTEGGLYSQDSLVKGSPEKVTAAAVILKSLPTVRRSRANPRHS